MISTTDQCFRPQKSTPNVEKEIDSTSDDLNDGEQLNEENMVVDMEEEASNKDESIVNSGTKSLETENKVLKEQLEQMKRVVTNMNKALKTKQGL